MSDVVALGESKVQRIKHDLIFASGLLLLETLCGFLDDEGKGFRCIHKFCHEAVAYINNKNPES